MKKIIWTIILLLLIIVISLVSYKFKAVKTNLPYACDADARLCADGSVVGRVGLSCEFAACPEVKASSSVDLAEVGTKLKLPLDNALVRVTKKPFGIKIRPDDSPVSPEKFSGYHTGVDFEITEKEKDEELKVYAICDGTVKLKKWASGYGGVLVSTCEIDEKPVTVIYGHLSLLSISAKVGDRLVAGNQLGILGKGYSQETDGERKHLHLAIHRGTALVLLGYVQGAGELKNWLDPLLYLK